MPTIDELRKMPMPELVERYRIRCTRIRQIESLSPPPNIILIEYAWRDEIEVVLAERGATPEQIKTWKSLDLTLEDVVGKPWCRASDNLHRALSRFLRAGGTFEEVIEHAAVAQELFDAENEEEDN